jgi:hypothetical protein
MRRRFAYTAFPFSFSITPRLRPAFGFADVRADVQRLQIVRGRAAVIALIRHDFLDHLDGAIVHSSHGLRVAQQSQTRSVGSWSVSPSSALHRCPDDRARLEIDRVLRLVGQVRPPIFHLGDLGVGIVRMRPVVISRVVRLFTYSWAEKKNVAMTAREALAFIRKHGVVLESARGPVPSLAQVIAGEPVRGSWWSHPKSPEIFAVTRAVRDSDDVLVCRLIDGKITFVHRRLWPALVRVADRLPSVRLSQLREVHTRSGRHVTTEVPFPDWVPSNVRAVARSLSEAAALAAFAWIE